jgi:CheY-like chemotaxis protein
MPETDGFAVINALASRPETADIPVVVLTAKTLVAADRERLDGRIAFVASKSALDLEVLAQRLVRVSRPATKSAP